MQKHVFFIPNLQTNYSLKLDSQNMHQHTAGKLIHGT